MCTSSNSSRSRPTAAASRSTVVPAQLGFSSVLSGELLRSLLAKGLLDRLNLWMYPIALGTGKRLFDTGTVPMAFRPAQLAHVFDSGVMALVFEPAGDVETGEVGAAEA